MIEQQILRAVAAGDTTIGAVAARLSVGIADVDAAVRSLVRGGQLTARLPQGSVPPAGVELSLTAAAIASAATPQRPPGPPRAPVDPLPTRPPGPAARAPQPASDDDDPYLPPRRRRIPRWAHVLFGIAVLLLVVLGVVAAFLPELSHALS